VTSTLYPPPRAQVTWDPAQVSREERFQALGGRGATVWLTGLPASGKSTIARALEARLVRAGRPAYRLDGDNLRHGLCSDLGFSSTERAENVRRAGEVAILMADAGLMVVACLVSPYARDRLLVRQAHQRQGLPFLEVWVSTPLEECQRRDPKGLYARARAGLAAGVTGVGDPYEEPEAPDLAIPAHRVPVCQAVDSVCALLAGSVIDSQASRP
jgi:adenylyl-sulfate kinase